MELLIDIGNSRMKWVLSDSGILHGGSSCSIASVRHDSELDRLWLETPRPERIWVSNVAGDQVCQALWRWFAKRWKLVPEFIQTQADGYGIVHSYRDPEKLGVDRWLALIATRHYFPLPACVVDCGTALTLDVLESGGRHRGGLICPGLRLMSEVLVEKTSAIEADREPFEPGQLLADHTSAAIQSGSLQALAGYLERMRRKLDNQFGQLHYLFTGGDAPLLMAQLDFEPEWVPDLVFQGMVVVSQKRIIQ